MDEDKATGTPLEAVGMTNTGVLSTPLRATDYVVGGISGADRVLLRESGDWTDLAPAYEPQSFPNYDTMACVSFSAMNCIEILEKHATGLEPNYSDRYLARMSETGPNGNYFYLVGDALRHNGAVAEAEWPTVPTGTRSDYYASVPGPVLEVGKKWLQRRGGGCEFG